uniref:Cadherin domain-containing protein n=1 Tax=Strix occidentalis caurina TaxID=311401 RepID=A0A8D0FS67_STROC
MQILGPMVNFIITSKTKLISSLFILRVLVKYKIISGNELGIFYLNPDSGVLQLKKSLINSGIKNSNFGLKITATDGENFADAMFVNISVVHGKVSSKTFSCRETRVAQKLAEKLLKKAKANVKLNLEDGFLDFYSVNRQAPLGTEIIQVEARDKDLGSNGEVTYSVLTDTQQFAINSSTGMVYVADQLDRESKANYTLKIEARDKAESGHQQFSVVPLKVFLDDVNDCSPAFIPSSYNVKVLEDLPVGTVIACHLSWELAVWNDMPFCVILFLVAWCSSVLSHLCKGRNTGKDA